MSTRLLAGRYELQEKIGDGGMAVVYKARCRLLNRFVAIKILKPEFARDLKFIESFRKESQAAAALSHPNIVNIYDVGREGNIHYIVMELIEGSILSDYISKEGPLEWKRAVEIGKQIASALAFAHKNHIIHRDVKPHNILLTGDGTAKITDFGIAKALDSSGSAEETTTVMGSVHYFSPEQARGGYVDEKSDIYSLGIVIFEMLTGTVPFDGENPVAVALMHINEEMPRPSSINPDIPPQIEEVVMKATDKLSINRYATADEMYDALAHAEFDAMMQAGSSRKNAAVLALEDEDAGSDAALMVASGETTEEKTEGDSEGEMGKGSKKEKKQINKIKLLAIILALVCALPVSIFISKIIGGGGDSGESFEVPDFRGQTYEVAKAVADEYGLTLKIGDEVYSVEYEEDQICSQLPSEGSSVKKGNTVTVNISKGAKEGTVPNLVGKSATDANYVLKKYGFKVGSVTSEPNDLPEGIVISQSPGAGEETNPGAYISYVVSAGKAEGAGIVPLLLGMTQTEAGDKLLEAGLELGTVTTEENGLYAPGQVFWQSKEAGSTADEGTPIDIKICGTPGSSSGSGSGSGTDGGSGVASVAIDYSAAKNEVFWLTVKVVDANGSHNEVNHVERYKSGGGETVYVNGVGEGSVTVIFDNDVVAQYNINFGGN